MGWGGDPAVHVATSAADYDAAWSELAFDADQPFVDLDKEIVVAFTVSGRAAHRPTSR